MIFEILSFYWYHNFIKTLMMPLSVYLPNVTRQVINQLRVTIHNNKIMYFKIIQDYLNLIIMLNMNFN